MATYSVIKFSNLSPIHMGTGRENYDFSNADLHSDTLTAALAAVRAQQGKTADLDAFLKSFTMSSAFPYSVNRFLMPVPKGILNVIIKDEEPHQYRKMLKKIRYADFSIWNRLIMGQSVTLTRNQIQGECIFDTESIGHSILSKSEVMERVGVPRDNGSKSEPFFFEWKFYDRKSGLFVLTDAKGDLLEEIVQLLELLGQNGVGTDKSVGGGKFDVILDNDLTIEEPENPNGQILLSLYVPQEKELLSIDFGHSVYSIELRGGYIAGSQDEKYRHLRKKSIYMFDVGSVLCTDISIEGKIVDLRPEWNDENLHSVYRSGRPLCVPMNVSL